MVFSIFAQNIENALQFFNSGLYFLAHKSFENIIDSREFSLTDLEICYFYRGLCSFKLSQYERAIYEFKNLILIFPKGRYEEQAKYYISISYFLLKKYTTAIKKFKEFLDEFPNSSYNSEVEFNIALSYVAIGFDYQAEKNFLNIINKYKDLPISLKAKFELAKFYFKNGEYLKAENLFKEILNRNIKDSDLNSEVILYLSNLKKEQNNLEAAIKYLKEVMNSDANINYKKIAHLSIAYIYFQMNKLTESKITLLEFIENYPESFDLMDKAYYILARISYYEKNFELSEKYLKIIINKFKKSEIFNTSLLLYVKILIEQGRNDEVLNLLNSFSFSDLIFLKITSDTYIKKFYFNEAKEILIELLNYELSENLKASIYYNLGNLYLKEGKKGEALNFFTKLFNEVSNAEIKKLGAFKIGQILFDDSKYDAALYYFEYAKSYLKDESKYYILKIYFYKGWNEKVLNIVDELKNYNENQAEILFYKAVAFYNLYKIDEAKKVFQFIIENYPQEIYSIKSLEYLIDIQDKKEDDIKFIVKHYKNLIKYNKLNEEYLKKILKILEENQNEKD